MRKKEIENHFTKNIKTTDIKGLLDYTNEKYRPYDPGLYLYILMSEYSFEEKFTDKFIELVYTTLTAWNMNQRGAKLCDFKVFKDSLIDNQSIIESLKGYKIEELDSIDILKKPIESLFKNLRLVPESQKRKLVTFSKTLHFFLPNLLMPIDHTYTLRFFNQYLSEKENQQIEVYLYVFEQFRLFAKDHKDDASFKVRSERWNKNFPKMIDNIIIAYISKKRELEEELKTLTDVERKLYDYMSEEGKVGFLKVRRQLRQPVSLESIDKQLDDCT